MKTFITSLLIVIVASIIVGCVAKQSDSTKVILLSDATDSLSSEPSAESILKFLDLNPESMWDAKEFVSSTISDVSYNFSRNAILPKENRWVSNELTRKKEVESFKLTVNKLINESNKGPADHSSVYLPIARGLIELSESNQTKRVLVVYSDLMENGIEITFYNKEVLKMLSTNPNLIIEQFETWQTLPSLKGIEIYLIYKPQDIDADAAFNAVSTFYKKMLEAKGAVVYIKANL